MKSATVIALAGLALLCGLFYNGVHFALLAASTTLLLIAVLIVLWPEKTGRNIELGVPGLLLLALLGWTLLGHLWSLVPYVTTIQLWLFLGAVLAYVAWKQSPYSASYSWLPVIPVLVCGIGVGAVAIFQFLSGEAPNASFLNRNSAAAFINLAWLPLAVMAFAPGISRRQISGIMLIVFLLVFAVGLTGGRGPLLAALAGVAIICVVTIALYRQCRQTGVLLLVVAAALLAANLVGAGYLGERAASLADPVSAGASRFSIWVAVLDMIKDKPWLGAGPGTFWLAYAAYRLPEDSSAGFHAHNDYMQYWAEGGVPAVALLLALAAACFYLWTAGFRAARRGQMAPVSMLVLTGLFAAVLATGLHSFLTYNLYLLPFLIVLGLYLASMEQTLPAACHWRLRLPAIPSGLLPAVGLVALVLTPVVPLMFSASALSAVERGQAYVAEQKFEEADVSYRLAASRWPRLDLSWYLRADLYRKAMEHLPTERAVMRQSLYDDALHFLAEAYSRNPLRAEIPTIEGQLHLEAEDLVGDEYRDKARASFEQALAMNPLAVRARLLLAQMHEEDGRIDAARHLVETGVGFRFGSNVNQLPLYREALRMRHNAGDEEGVREMAERIGRIQTRHAISPGDEAP